MEAWAEGWLEAWMEGWRAVLGAAGCDGAAGTSGG